MILSQQSVESLWFTVHFLFCIWELNISYTDSQLQIKSSIYALFIRNLKAIIKSLQ